jgi:hypothetical protein
MPALILSRRERFLLAAFGGFVLFVGIVAALVEPRSIAMACACLSVGSALILAGGFGRLVIPRFLAWVYPGHPVCPRPDQVAESFTEPDQTVTHVSIAGVRHPRIRCGSEAEVGTEMTFCSDCFAQAGQYHAIGCDLEECPKCHTQMISCGCGIDEMQTAE